MLTADLFLLIFVLLDDFLKHFPDLLRRPGPDPNVSDAETMTLMLLQALSGEISDEAWLRRVERDFGDCFPVLPERSRYQRRRAVLARPLLALAEWIQRDLGEDPRIRIADSAPIPICRNARGNRCRTFRGEGSWGWCAAQKAWFFGFRLHLMVTERGLPAAWTILTARRHDRKGLEALLSGRRGLDVYGDAAYNVRPRDRQPMAERDITVTAAPKKNMRPLPKAQAKTLRRLRFRVDWSIGLLSRVFLVQRTLARRTHTLAERVSFCLAADNVGAWVNHCVDRPLFAIKALAA